MSNKIAFSKLGLKRQDNIQTVKIGDFDIEVKQYLPVNEKLELISRVINAAHDSNNFSNPVHLDVYTSLEIVFEYTNLTFTDKQKEDVVKLFDILESNNIFNQIIAAIPEDEYNSLISGIEECSNAIYSYRNSVAGVLETVAADYSNVDMNTQEIANRLNDPNNMALLRDVLTKLG